MRPAPDDRDAEPVPMPPLPPAPSVRRPGAPADDLSDELGSGLGGAGPVATPGWGAPAQLPLAPRYFINRSAELQMLDRLATRDGRRPTVVVFTGAGGVGKTGLGLQWAHQVRDRLGADGQLYADLRGYSGRGLADPREPLEMFLKALGVAPDAVPAAVDEQAALFRTVTGGRRLIIMLDNAASDAQVRPLLPGSGPAVVLVTSRRRLTGLRARDGADHIDLAPFDEAGSLQLLERMAGPARIGAHPQAARSLVSRCGGLPLAVCLCAAQLAVPRRTIGRLVEELDDERRRLAALDIEGDDAMSEIFNTSYGSVSAAAARLYRLLAVHPGPDVDASMAAALAGVSHGDAGRLLETLADVHLIEQRTQDHSGDRFGARYGFHDLARPHALGKLEATEDETERRAAFTRLADWLLKAAACAQLKLNPNRPYLAEHFHQPRDELSFPDQPSALEWLETQAPNLLAVQARAHAERMHHIVRQIPEAMWGWFLLRKPYRQWQESHEIGLAAAEACGDLKAQGRMLEGLASLANNRRDVHAATDYATRAIAVEYQAGHLVGEASAWDMLGVANLIADDLEAAADSFTRARDLHERCRRPRGVALMDRYLGQVATAAGRHDEAIACITRALAHFTDTAGEAYNTARALSARAGAYLAAGRLDEAEADLRRSLAITQKIRAHHEEANICAALAHLADRQGQPDRVRDLLERALAIYTAIGAPQAQQIAEQLAALSVGDQ